MALNNAINSAQTLSMTSSPTFNALTLTTSVAAGTTLLTVANTDNTSSSSNALSQITTGGASSGDPLQTYTVTGATSWSQGIDNSASDAWKLSQGTALGTNDAIVVSTARAVTMPAQPAFYAYLAATVNNKTGNGATYILGTDSLTEVFDLGGNFNINGTFTAPVTGIYEFSSQITVTGTTIATSFFISIVTTSRTYTYTLTKAASSANQTVSINVLALMSASDTAIAQIIVVGEAGDTDDIQGDATVGLTYFCGKLVA